MFLAFLYLPWLMDGEGLPETPLLLTLVGVLERALLVLAFFLKTLMINDKTYVVGGEEMALDTMLISIMACTLELLTREQAPDISARGTDTQSQLHTWQGFHGRKCLSRYLNQNLRLNYSSHWTWGENSDETFLKETDDRINMSLQYFTKHL